jgi:hypothetical protein
MKAPWPRFQIGLVWGDREFRDRTRNSGRSRSGNPGSLEYQMRASLMKLKLVRLPLTTWGPVRERVSCAPLFLYCPVRLNVFVSRVVQTGLPEFGTLLAHIWPQGARVDALEDLINLFCFIDLEWSHPPGSNWRPADYECVSLYGINGDQSAAWQAGAPFGECDQKSGWRQRCRPPKRASLTITKLSNAGLTRSPKPLLRSASFR